MTETPDHHPLGEDFFTERMSAGTDMSETDSISAQNSAAHGGCRAATCYALRPVLDACCGSRMMWFDKADDRAVFVDIRDETCVQKSKRWNDRYIEVRPDIVADFQNLPFPSDSFSLVVFDPPHLEKIGATSTTAKTYGKLLGDWRDTLAAGFAECFRVLKPGGTLIFKWCEFEIPLTDVLALTPEKPLFGTKYGKREKSHWVTFIKHNSQDQARGASH